MSLRVRPRVAKKVMPKERQRRPDVRTLGDLRPGERPSERRPVVIDGHLPVMVDEVLHFLRPAPGSVIVDGTVGAGGHAEAVLLSSSGRCTVIGVDRDPSALARAGHRLERFGDHVRLVRSGFDALEWIVNSLGHDRVDGILLDLGMSSMQVDDPWRFGGRSSSSSGRRPRSSSTTAWPSTLSGSSLRLPA